MVDPIGSYNKNKDMTLEYEYTEYGMRFTMNKLEDQTQFTNYSVGI